MHSESPNRSAPSNARFSALPDTRRLAASASCSARSRKTGGNTRPTSLLSSTAASLRIAKTWHGSMTTSTRSTKPRPREPSIAIWRRGRSELEAFGDFNLLPAEIVDQASRAGRLCRSLVDAFAESRVRIFDALELDENGEVVAFHPTHVPWTYWLRPADLTEDQWNVIGAGPKLTWVGDHENA